ncbi:hypothetical protein CLOP_g14244, partial [Closterium sp. NIES-67]
LSVKRRLGAAAGVSTVTGTGAGASAGSRPGATGAAVGSAGATAAAGGAVTAVGVRGRADTLSEATGAGIREGNGAVPGTGVKSRLAARLSGPGASRVLGELEEQPLVPMLLVLALSQMLWVLFLVLLLLLLLLVLLGGDSGGEEEKSGGRCRITSRNSSTIATAWNNRHCWWNRSSSRVRHCDSSKNQGTAHQGCYWSSTPKSAGDTAPKKVCDQPASAAGEPDNATASASAGKAPGRAALFSGPRPLSELLKRKRASNEGEAGQTSALRAEGATGQGKVGKARRLLKGLGARAEGGLVGAEVKTAGTGASMAGTGVTVVGTGAAGSGASVVSAMPAAPTLVEQPTAGAGSGGVVKAAAATAAHATTPAMATDPASAAPVAVPAKEEAGQAVTAKATKDVDDGILLIRSGSSQSKGERAVGEVDFGDEDLVGEDDDEDYDLEGKLGDLW